MALGRRPTPGEGQYAFIDTEEPTRPGAPTPADRWEAMARLLANLAPEERRSLVLLADYWFHCDANDRAILGALAHRLAR